MRGGAHIKLRADAGRLVLALRAPLTTAAAATSGRLHRERLEALHVAQLLHRLRLRLELLGTSVCVRQRAQVVTPAVVALSRQH